MSNKDKAKTVKISRRRTIFETTQKILSSHRISTPPIPIESILENEGIRVVPKNLDRITGAAVFKDGRMKIVYDKNQHEQRLRFTLAHEYGHLKLHSDKGVNFDEERSQVFFRDSRSSTGKHWREIEANLFAASLLMPETMIEEYLDKEDSIFVDDKMVEKLASEFDVSITAMAIRLGSLGLT